MPVLMSEIGVRIPAEVVDLESFRRWARSDDYPEKARISYLRGDILVLVDQNMQQLFTHIGVKTEIYIVLGAICRSEKLGRFFSDGALVSNPAADLASEPDAVFASNDTLDSGRVRFIDATSGGAIEVLGSPDMVLEVVSKSSVRKDTVDLVELYYDAGITEYWLVDARAELQFKILRRAVSEYEKTPADAEGWVRSEVFGRSFRLVESTDRFGQPNFTLEVQA